jgi:CDP-4-dehydro-6-deoxyglucose reductase
MFSVQINGKKSFEADGARSILDAALNSNLFIPYSCTTGRCNTCKCRVLAGETTPLMAESGLTEEDIAEGWILSCARSATSDLVLEISDSAEVALPEIKLYPCRVHALTRIAPDVLQVLLRLPPTVQFTFLPGQYIEVIGEGGAHRAYSIAGVSGNLLELHIRKVTGGWMSRYWFEHAKPNDLLRLRGPKGTFFLRDCTGLDLVFLATGTGIAPVKAILEDFLPSDARTSARKVSVFWGGRTSADLYFDVAGLGSTIQYLPVLSRAGAGWTGARGYVQEVFLQMKPDLMNSIVYACGSETMIHSARTQLLRAGLPEGRFFSDAFVCTQ